MRLEYSYSFLLDFNSVVDLHQFALMTKPRREGQAVSEFQHNLRACDFVIDGFGNEIMYGSVEEPHNSFYFSSSGVVESADRRGLGAIHSEVFLQSTKLVPFCAELSKYDKKLRLKGKSPYEKASYICSFIFDHFIYFFIAQTT